MPDSNTGSTGAGRRGFLKTVGAISVVGLAGCGGDGGETPTGTATETDASSGTATGTDTPTGTATDTDTPSGTATDTDTPSGTATDTEPGTDTQTPVENRDFGENPATLLALEGDTTVEAGGTITLTGTVENIYLFPVQSIEISLDPPGDDWEITATGETSFEEVAEQGTRETGWEVVVPDDANGDYTIEGTVSYESATDQATVDLSYSVVVFEPGELPQEGTEAHFSFDSDTATNRATATDATVIGDPTTGVSGAFDNSGEAWEFTGGGGGGDDSVTDAVESAQDLPINGQEATIAGWFRHESHPENTEEFGRILCADDGVDTNNHNYSILFRGSTANAINLYVGNDTSNISVSPGTWYFVAATVDGDTGTLYVFDEDGELDGSPVSAADARSQTGSEKLCMMAGDAREVAGRMDEAFAFSTALSQSEVVRLYNNSV
jgi:hypothetical protein